MMKNLQSMQTKELVVKGLSKKYGGRQVLHDVSFSASTGKIIGLLGPNGAGKTTMFYILIGLIKADSGEVLLNGQNIISLPMAKRSRLGLGYLPQGSSVFRDLTVEENIIAALEFQPNLNRVQRKEKMESFLNDFSLTHIRSAKGRVLSGGERRRTEMARLLASNPDFILMDEPFAGVDPVSIDGIKELIIGLTKRNIGVIINDHNVADVLRLCDINYVLNEGRIIAKGDAKTIVQNALVRKSYLGENYVL